MTTTVTTLDDGLGGSGQDELNRAAPLMTQGTIYYVHHTGSDTNDGLTPETPKATTAAAVALMANGDMLVWLASHAETLTTGVNLGGLDRCVLVGLGDDANGDPSVVLSPALTNPATVAVDLGGGAFCELRNVRIAASTASTFVVRSTGEYTHLTRVVLEGGAGNTAGLLRPGSHNRIENCTFRSTAPDTTARPKAAIDLSSLAPTLRNVTLDGGDSGWTSSALYDAGGGGGGATGVAFDGITLVNSDVLLTSRVTGWVQFRSIDPNSSFAWAQGAVAANALRHFPSGVGATGDSGLVAPNGPFYSNKPVIWCNYATGSDARSGVTKALAKKTLQAAITAAGTGGTVLVVRGHAEPTSSLVAIGNDYVTVIGIGRTSGLPACRVVRTSGTDGTLSCTGTGARVYNLHFASTVTVTSLGITAAAPSTTTDFMVALGGTNNQFRSCVLALNSVVVTGLQVGAANSLGPLVSDVTVTAYGTSMSSRPTNGVKVQGTYSESVLLENLVVDSGAYGFSGVALNCQDATYGLLRGYNINLLRGSCLYIDAEFEESMVTLGTVNGGGEVIWDTVA
jgi:hypothetical protein